MRVMMRRRRVIIGALGVAAATAGCTSSGKGKTEETAWVEPVTEAAQVIVPVKLSVTPAANATGWSPVKPIVVAAESGTLTSVTVTNGATKVAGEMHPDGTWRSTADLDYN